MFKALGVIRFNNRMNKSAKIACKELGLDYLQMVSPLGDRWQMELLQPTIDNLNYYCREEKWNDYELAIGMIMNGLGKDQIVGAPNEHFERISDRIRWWGNIGVLPKSYVESTINHLCDCRLAGDAKGV